MNKKNNSLSEAYSYILFALTEPLHGYGIMQKVEVLSMDTVKLGPGTLYGALTNMEKKGWIVALDSDDSRRKNYRLTIAGQSVLEMEVNRIKQLNLAACQSLINLEINNHEQN